MALPPEVWYHIGSFALPARMTHKAVVQYTRKLSETRWHVLDKQFAVDPREVFRESIRTFDVFAWQRYIVQYDIDYLRAMQFNHYAFSVQNYQASEAISPDKNIWSVAAQFLLESGVFGASYRSPQYVSQPKLADNIAVVVGVLALLFGVADWSWWRNSVKFVMEKDDLYTLFLAAKMWATARGTLTQEILQSVSLFKKELDVNSYTLQRAKLFVEQWKTGWVPEAKSPNHQIRPWFFTEQGFPRVLLRLWPVVYTDYVDNNIQYCIGSQWWRALKLVVMGYSTEKVRNELISDMAEVGIHTCMEPLVGYIFSIKELCEILRVYAQQSGGISQYNEWNNPLMCFGISWDEIRPLLQ